MSVMDYLLRVNKWPAASKLSRCRERNSNRNVFQFSLESVDDWMSIKFWISLRRASVCASKLYRAKNKPSCLTAPDVVGSS